MASHSSISRSCRAERRAAALLAGVVLAPASASAHALAQRYDLPLPLGLYLAGAGATVALTCVLLVALGSEGGRAWVERARLALPMPAGLRRVAFRLAQGLGVTLLLVIVVAGLLGAQSPTRNIAPVTVWVVLWVGLSFVAAFIGNPWPALNPWAALYDVAAAAGRRLGVRSVPPRRYREAVGTWPAVLLLLGTIGLELVWPDAERPRALAIVILLYSILTWAGMALFGRDRWLAAGEVFSVYFSLLGRAAPISGGGLDRDPALTARPPLTGLLGGAVPSASLTAFVLLMLAGVTFDGLIETPVWAAAMEATTPAFQGAVTAAALIGAPLVLFLLFAAACRAIPLPAQVAPERLFVLTLLPIAVGYHLAHNLSYLLLAGQFAIPLASDPLGFGWDLFGTKLYRIDLGIIDAATVWTISVAAIVVGHVAAVWLAHAVALAAYGPAGGRARVQVPLLLLMVGYTMTSLWILAQPITRS